MTKMRSAWERIRKNMDQFTRWLERETEFRRRSARPTWNGPVGGRPKPTAPAVSEDELKQKLQDWLEAAGWGVHVAWGRQHGVDIDARRGSSRWVIEVKGQGSLDPMRVNFFLCVLGEILQRMNDDQARYSIAFPDHRQFRGLWQRLPPLARQRTGISALFVSGAGQVEEVK